MVGAHHRPKCLDWCLEILSSSRLQKARANPARDHRRLGVGGLPVAGTPLLLLLLLLPPPLLLLLLLPPLLLLLLLPPLLLPLLLLPVPVPLWLLGA